MLVEIWFLNNGVRKNTPYGTTYCPHFVVKCTNEYLGIQFENLQKSQFNEHIKCSIKLLYETVDYSNLKSGAYFDIKEGACTVGEGFVIE